MPRKMFASGTFLRLALDYKAPVLQRLPLASATHAIVQQLSQVLPSEARQPRLPCACIANAVPSRQTPAPKLARPVDGRFVRGRERSGAGQARAARIHF
jgi:hypothetical protein